jgi:hypothetical protein
MNKPNIVDNAKQKFQNFRWPVWLPYPSCWLKSFILMLFLRLIGFMIEFLIKFSYGVAKFANSPELIVISGILVLLSPIIIIAFTHHYLHLVFSRFISEIQAPEIGNVKGLLPQLMSWWEGLYGWLVIVLSTLIAGLFCTLVLPVFGLNYTKTPENYTEFEKQIILMFGIIWLTQGSLIYQIDYLVKQRLISVYSNLKKI